jgi:hypothetical protein
MEPEYVDGKLCAGCRRVALDPVPKQSAGGQRLCGTCCDRLAKGIRELPHLYTECMAVLGGGVARGVNEKVTGGPLPPGMALNSFAAEARTEILSILGSWSGLVAQQCRVPTPSRQAAALAGFLLANLTWLASHPAAGDLSAEVERTVKVARRAAYPDYVKRIVVGCCVISGCDGELAATVRVGAYDKGTQVRCGANPDHAWSGHEWTLLRRAMRRPERTVRQRWLAAADIANLWSAPTGTVYRLASEQGWRRTTRAGRTYYAEDDVHSSFSRREARSRGMSTPEPDSI